ncbi:hypothetical protein KVR01_000723 [Diaporthe batatas]|uniref:mitochondrial 37S ribosomal protein YmS18 n=1 Tax=Diaporthe batatas TaxID=748121 RepID=UPI001D037345|nr:mitochondrial 37S ribosomal protein YmS18 [Diaporthe batatas]KAG8169978.1 hypothetical protein KVR01_000723 [Diaporthe batatas]
MSRSTTSRRLASKLYSSLSKPSIPRPRCAAAQLTQPFSISSRRRADDEGRPDLLLNLNKLQKTSTTYAPRPTPPQKSPSMKDLLQVMPAAQVASGRAVNDTRAVNTSVLESGDGLSGGAEDSNEQGGEPYHFHIYSHKHNTHVTVTKPNRDAIVSLSCGNLGFRKSQRKHYDAAYQLGAYVIDKLQQQGWHKKINSLEVVLRGFGPGREAITKVILGNEGRLLREKIVKVSDATRLKFGGTRSKRPRRLG